MLYGMIYVYDSICRSFYYLTWFILWLKYCFKANFEKKDVSCLSVFLNSSLIWYSNIDEHSIAKALINKIHQPWRSAHHLDTSILCSVSNSNILIIIITLTYHHFYNQSILNLYWCYHQLTSHQDNNLYF